MLSYVFAFLAGAVIGILDSAFGISKLLQKFHIWRIDAADCIIFFVLALGWYIIGFDDSKQWDGFKMVPSMIGFLVTPLFWPDKWTRR